MNTNQRGVIRTTRSLSRAVGVFALLALPALLIVAETKPEAPDPVTGPSMIAPPPAVTAPTPAPTTPAATQSAESVLQNLLHPAPAVPSAALISVNPTVVPPVPGVAPAQPPVVRLREGQNVYNRIGRLVRDEKTQQWLFAFESDGQEMKDPPISLIPSKMLEAMEDASAKGTKPLRFKISGEITEYHGKNYLHIRFMQTVRDLNQF